MWGIGNRGRQTTLPRLHVAGDGTWRKCVVFGEVMSDVAMLDAVLELDVWGKERVEGGHRGSVLSVCYACVMCHVVLCGGCTVVLCGCVVCLLCRLWVHAFAVFPFLSTPSLPGPPLGASRMSVRL